MARQPNQGFNALKTALLDVGPSIGKAAENMFGGASGTGSVVGRATRGVIDRAAGGASLLVRPFNWMLKGKITGPLALIGGAGAIAVGIKNHYSDQRDTVNALGYNPEAVTPVYKNSVSPEDYAAMQSRLKDSTPAGFAAAEAEKRTQPQPQPQSGAKL
ncbi:MAG: hypothetical protein C0436_02795 [Alphaproteobacteria bacterium]|nr:hypothetical protein [Alphaproteobacteria bacterium]